MSVTFKDSFLFYLHLHSTVQQGEGGPCGW